MSTTPKRGRTSVRSDLILRAIERRHKEDFFTTEAFLSAPGGRSRRLDGLAIRYSYSAPLITGYEVKISRSDFLRDDKWPEYVGEVSQLYFACPEGLIRQNELPEEVGLLYYNPETACVRTIRKAKRRDITPSWEMMMRLVLNRTVRERHPYFSSSKEAILAFMEEKEHNHQLAYQLSGRISSLSLENKRLLDKVEELEDELKEAREVERVIRSRGINYRSPASIEKALNGAVSDSAVRAVLDAENAISRLRKAVCGE